VIATVILHKDVPKISQYLCTIRLQAVNTLHPAASRSRKALTPASTLVMSKTRIPANGSFSIAFLSTFADAAIPRVHVLLLRAGKAFAACQHHGRDCASLAHKLEDNGIVVLHTLVVRCLSVIVKG
jgi:hypothetical protein